MIFLNTRNIIGKRIRELRTKKKITQEDLAARMNILEIEIDRPMISRIENQSREIVDFEIQAIAKILGVTIDDLFK
jgi:HTH-type transcriptional regulator, cell division transcriptional repressor